MNTVNHLVFATFPLSHALMTGLAALWWAECNGTSGTIALCGLGLCLAAMAYADRALNLWLHVAIVAHLLCGMRFGLYESRGSYDELVHALAVMALVIIVVQRLAAHADYRPLLNTAPRRLALSASLALAFGGAWELFEFFVDTIFNLNAQTGLTDTNLDLLADLIGGVGAFSVLSIRRPHRSAGRFQRTIVPPLQH